LAELGYWLDVFLLDANYFVPQSRPRVFVTALHVSVKRSLSIERGQLMLFGRKRERDIGVSPTANAHFGQDTLARQLRL
jgi:site-specific DNA-cytosine methylase